MLIRLRGEPLWPACTEGSAEHSTRRSKGELFWTQKRLRSRFEGRGCKPEALKNGAMADVELIEVQNRCGMWDFIGGILSHNLFDFGESMFGRFRSRQEEPQNASSQDDEGVFEKGTRFHCRNLGQRDTMRENPFLGKFVREGGGIPS
jgi:hypothetical protein